MVSLTSQLIALRRLAVMESERALVTQRLTSGLKLADRTDSTRIAALSGQLTRATAQLSSVQTSLNGGIATVQAAASALRSTKGTLESLRSVLTDAKDSGADLSALQSRFKTLTSQLRSNVSGASFAGVNLLATNGATRFDAAPADERGQTYTIGVDSSRTRLYDTTGTSGILQRTFDLTPATSTVAAPSTLGLRGSGTLTSGVSSATPTLDGLSGSASSINGLAANAIAPALEGLSGSGIATDGIAALTPSLDGLSGTVASGTATPASTLGAAMAYVGTYTGSGNGGGDKVQLSVNLNGETKTVSVSQRTINSASTFRDVLQQTVTTAFGANKLTVRMDGSRIYLDTVAQGAEQSLSVSNIKVVDGNDITTSTLGLQTATNYSRETSTIDGTVRVRDKIGVPNFSNIDRSDRLQFRIDAQTYDADGKVTSQSDGRLITVSLTGVNTAAELATRINDTILANSYYKNFIGAAIDGTEIAIYHKQSNGGIKLTSVTPLNGDDTVVAGDKFGLVDGSGTGTSNVQAVAASATTGSNFTAPLTLRDGATLKFDLAVNGGTAKLATIDEATIAAALGAGKNTINTIDDFVTVVARSVATAGIGNVTVSKDGNRLKFTKTGTVAGGDSVSLTNIQRTTVTATNAKLVTGSDFSEPVTIETGSTLDFRLTVDGQDTNVSITKADVETALGAQPGRAPDTGTISNATEFAQVVKAALDRASVTGISVSSVGNKLLFTKTTAGSGSIAISSVGSTSVATNAIATGGSDFTTAITLERDAEITFDINIDNAGARTVRIQRSTVEVALNGSNTIGSISELASAARQALAEANIAGITVGTNGNKLTFTRDSAGAGSIAVSNAQAVASTAVAAALRTGTDFSGPVTIDSGATIGFDLALDGGASKRVTITRSTVESALAGVLGRTRDTGVISDVSQFALVVSQAIVEAGVSSVTVAADGNALRLSKNTAGSGDIMIGNVVSAVAAVREPSTTRLEGINLGSLENLSLTDRRALLDDYVRNVEAMTRSVEGAATHLASVARQLDIQSDHTARLQAIETARLNRQVKIDIDGETAKKAALDARLALARQAISIISESRKNVLNILTPQLL